ncbi:TetR/AcrR family transcriptional regulator [Burkholderia gladioli]|jgi:AcrR family transcriptional regulator|uniref:TetR/AcrR family transcriptional regulator n=1 Tax=Burkholderia gladioli TaxID=28095 RepID=UPI000CDB4909|nr:TetR/AcrR family transcriptional regulator [Burkholderia gladioli]KAF1064749.1 HTH-type transcriptional repressor KstR [Burkholderia gladioli]MBU9179857.1 TetR/AcrR family transcriptional regulator [Burkholderia gladioli]MBU9642553.1 TetR/AcrR family transcriptional regulator [Burkholderia gladioli]MBU9687646.1 TetR/AcrR family transcriptional regulator [Burkholderia gladioli]MDJ1162789.1 helix-turn-helix domain-containing protein [Burkholderia gladioli pv. gladioli]
MTDRPRRPRLQPRKNPTQPRAAGTVAAIVEAAAQVLETRGIEGFNTNAVAERAGVSIGSLYQYFPGKDALTVALMQRETQRFVEDMDRAMAEPDGMVALGLLIGAAVRQQLQRPMLARLLDEQEASPALRDAVDCDGMDTPVAAILRRLLPAGDARAAHAAVDLGEIIHVMVDSAGARGEQDIASLETRLRAAVFGYLRELRLLPAAAPAGPSA